MQHTRNLETAVPDVKKVQQLAERMIGCIVKSQPANLPCVLKFLLSAELEEHGSIPCVHLLQTVLDNLQVSRRAHACVLYRVHSNVLLTASLAWLRSSSTTLHGKAAQGKFAKILLGRNCTLETGRLSLW